MAWLLCLIVATLAAPTLCIDPIKVQTYESYVTRLMALDDLLVFAQRLGLEPMRRRAKPPAATSFIEHYELANPKRKADNGLIPDVLSHARSYEPSLVTGQTPLLTGAISVECEHLVTLWLGACAFETKSEEFNGKTRRKAFYAQPKLRTDDARHASYGLS